MSLFLNCWNLSKTRENFIARLEEAYIVSRDLPYSFEEREVRDIHRFVVEVFKHDVEKV